MLPRGTLLRVSTAKVVNVQTWPTSQRVSFARHCARTIVLDHRDIVSTDMRTSVVARPAKKKSRNPAKSETKRVRRLTFITLPPVPSVAKARSLFGVVINNARTPGSVVLEICRSSSIMSGNSPATAEAVTPISPPGLSLGPVKTYVKVGSRPLPRTQMLT